MKKFDRQAHDEQLWEEFQNESQGSYDMVKFREWYRKRLYSEKGLKLLQTRKKQKRQSG